MESERAQKCRDAELGHNLTGEIQIIFFFICSLYFTALDIKYNRMY